MGLARANCPEEGTAKLEVLTGGGWSCICWRHVVPGSPGCLCLCQTFSHYAAEAQPAAQNSTNKGTCSAAQRALRECWLPEPHIREQEVTGRKREQVGCLWVRKWMSRAAGLELPSLLTQTFLRAGTVGSWKRPQEKTWNLPMMFLSRALVLGSLSHLLRCS